RRVRTVDALRNGVDRRFAGRRVDDVVDRLTLGTLHDEVRHVLEEVVHRGVRVLLVVPLDREVEVIRQVRLQRRVAAVRGERTDARQSAYVQNRRQEVDRRTGQGARRSEAQMHILGDLELGV